MTEAAGRSGHAWFPRAHCSGCADTQSAHPPTAHARFQQFRVCLPTQGGMWVVHRTCRLTSHAGEGRAQNQTGRTRQTDTRGSGGERAGADTRRVDTIDATACHHPPQRERERERGQQRPGPWTATAPGGGGCCRSTAPARRQELCVWAVRRGCCRRWLQTDSHTGAGVRGTRGKGGSADTGDMKRGGAAARRTGRGIAPVAGPEAAVGEPCSWTLLVPTLT